jgi:hypothetical protein
MSYGVRIQERALLRRQVPRQGLLGQKRGDKKEEPDPDQPQFGNGIARIPNLFPEPAHS